VDRPSASHKVACAAAATGSGRCRAGGTARRATGRRHRRPDAAASDYLAGGESSSSNASSPDRLLARTPASSRLEARRARRVDGAALQCRRELRCHSPEPSEGTSRHAQRDAASPRSSFLGAATALGDAAGSQCSSMLASLATSDNDGEDEAERSSDRRVSAGCAVPNQPLHI